MFDLFLSFTDSWRREGKAMMGLECWAGVRSPKNKLALIDQQEKIGAVNPKQEKMIDRKVLPLTTTNTKFKKEYCI